jgi:hypothetical protein
MGQHTHNHDRPLVGGPVEDASQSFAVSFALGGIIELDELCPRFRHSSPPVTNTRVPDAQNHAFLRGHITYHHIAANKMFVAI